MLQDKSIFNACPLLRLQSGNSFLPPGALLHPLDQSNNRLPGTTPENRRAGPVQPLICSSLPLSRHCPHTCTSRSGMSFASADSLDSHVHIPAPDKSGSSMGSVRSPASLPTNGACTPKTSGTLTTLGPESLCSARSSPAPSSPDSPSSPWPTGSCSGSNPPQTPSRGFC